MRVKISCNVNTRDAILNFCSLLYLIGRLICSEWINKCVPTLSMKIHLFRSFADNEFICPAQGAIAPHPHGGNKPRRRERKEVRANVTALPSPSSSGLPRARLVRAGAFPPPLRARGVAG